MHDKLIIKYLEGKATLNESKQISDWLDLDIKNQQYFVAFKKSFIELQLNTTHKANTEEAYQKFVEKTEQFDKNVMDWEDDTEFLLFTRKFWKYAAIILLFLTFGGGAYIIGKKANNKQNNAYCEISAPLGGKSSVVLPDGTKIWLNAGSKIKYGSEFNINSREIFLEGEAYFDVSKKKQPFIVHTSDLDIRVFGTSFNVKSYPDEDKIETTLVEGSIRIDRKESKEPLYLKPKEKLVFRKHNTAELSDETIKDSVIDNGKITTKESVKEDEIINPVEISKNVNTEESVSWKDGSLIFNQETLESLAKKLERKYDIIFIFENEELKNYSFSGTLRDFPLEQVLKAIKYTSPINYTVTEKKVVLSFNKKFGY